MRGAQHDACRDGRVRRTPPGIRRRGTEHRERLIERKGHDDGIEEFVWTASTTAQSASAKTICWLFGQIVCPYCPVLG
jgi:hypothetical protein